MESFYARARSRLALLRREVVEGWNARKKRGFVDGKRKVTPTESRRHRCRVQGYSFRRVSPLRFFRLARPSHAPLRLNTLFLGIHTLSTDSATDYNISNCLCFFTFFGQF